MKKAKNILTNFINNGCSYIYIYTSLERGQGIKIIFAL